MTEPELRLGQAHLWRYSLNVSSERLAMLAATLDRSEQERAAALRAAQLRARFIVGRGLLRETLARYAATPPEALRLRVGACGKPALDGEPDSGLRFNLSHCDDLLLIAVTRQREVGVDLERVRPITSMAQIAESLFSAEERAALEGAAAELREWRFVQLWTRHEAIAKGGGGGLARAPTDELGWSIFELNPAPGYIASLALEGEGWHAGAMALPGETGGPWAGFVLQQTTEAEIDYFLRTLRGVL